MKKTFYKRWWFILIVVLLVIGAFSSGDDKEQNLASESNQAETVQDVEVDLETQVEDNVPTEFKSALNKDQIYSDMMHMSKVGYTIN